MSRVFTAGFDIVENVAVVAQVAVEDEQHGKLRKDKTQLRRKRERAGTDAHMLLQLLRNVKTKDEEMKTYVEDDEEDRLEDDDVDVTRSLRKLLLLLHMLVLVVDVLVVLLCHPACDSS